MAHRQHARRSTLVLALGPLSQDVPPGAVVDTDSLNVPTEQEEEAS